MDNKRSSKTWLITGCSSGLGRALAIEALKTGHKVIATSRDPRKTPDAVTEIEAFSNGHFEALDVTSPDLESTVQAIVAKYGAIHVLVNNAGYAAAGASEDFSAEQARDMFETNVIGPFRLIKRVLPSMRAARSGMIVNVTSASVLAPEPSVALYRGTKCALDGYSETLAAEVAEFGVRVVVAIPADTRTNFNKKATMVPLSEGYKTSLVSRVLEYLVGMDGKQNGDPKKIAERIVEAVDGTGVVGHVEDAADKKLLYVPMGEQNGKRLRERAMEYTKLADLTEPIWRSTDFIVGING